MNQTTCISNIYINTIGCNSACSHCFNDTANDCISCSNPGKILYEGACLDNCPNEYYVQNHVCLSKLKIYTLLACNPSCSACKNGAKAGCLNCSNNLKFYKGECLDNCPDGSYENNSYCFDCPSNCKTCTNLLQCQSCLDPTFLNSIYETCVTKDQCPKGTYPDEETRECNKCDISCERCTGPTFKECIECNKSLGYTSDLKSGQCKKIKCYNGQYLSFLTGEAICLPCGPRCKTCNSDYPTKCTKCKSGYFEFPVENETVECKICDEIPGLMKGENDATCAGLN